MTSVITEPIQNGLNNLATACDQLSSAIKTQQKKEQTSVVIAKELDATPINDGLQQQHEEQQQQQQQQQQHEHQSEASNTGQIEGDILGLKADQAANQAVEADSEANTAAAPVVEDQAANQAVEADSEANTAAAPVVEDPAANQAAAPFPKPPPSGPARGPRPAVGGTRKPRMHKRKKTQRKRSKTIKKKNKA
jgi:hypothetical protein